MGNRGHAQFVGVQRMPAALAGAAIEDAQVRAARDRRLLDAARGAAVGLGTGAWLWLALLGPVAVVALQRYSAAARRRQVARIAAPECLNCERSLTVLPAGGPER